MNLCSYELFNLFAEIKRIVLYSMYLYLFYVDYDTSCDNIHALDVVGHE